MRLCWSILDFSEMIFSLQPEQLGPPHDRLHRAPRLDLSDLNEFDKLANFAIAMASKDWSSLNFG